MSVPYIADTVRSNICQLDPKKVEMAFVVASSLGTQLGEWWGQPQQ